MKKVIQGLSIKMEGIFGRLSKVEIQGSGPAVVVTLILIIILLAVGYHAGSAIFASG